MPEESATGAFAASEADLFFQAAGPFGAGAVVGEGELFAEFVPGGTLAVVLQVLLDGGFEFEVAHGETAGSWRWRVMGWCGVCQRETGCTGGPMGGGIGPG